MKYETCRYPLFFDGYAAREAAKKAAAESVSDPSRPLAVRVTAALRHVRAHLDRSLEVAHATRRAQQHPTFEWYARMIDLNVYGLDRDVLAGLRARVGEPVRGSIESGYTVFEPRQASKVPRRRLQTTANRRARPARQR